MIFCITLSLRSFLSTPRQLRIFALSSQKEAHGGEQRRRERRGATLPSVHTGGKHIRVGGAWQWGSAPRAKSFATEPLA